MSRRALWDVGLDYRHGRGHRVACSLYAHQDPQSIGTRIGSDNNLLPGMNLSDDWLIFEQLTIIPIQPKLIYRSLLNNNEINYINKYDERVRQIILDEMKKVY
ncbi:unnamed protein product [Rotaria sordida]|uniref:Peptidase M24 C-terminal domain-containing protein n=1 Tax=Rotaria sordida TaxID=392033 RepID=A0A819VT84_9BILA|nr:unnamed protein product [Rotaria sordida]